jgi:hypothetical protein
MSTNTKLSFLVVYEEQEFSFQLFEDNTVREYLIYNCRKKKIIQR